MEGRPGGGSAGRSSWKPLKAWSDRLRRILEERCERPARASVCYSKFMRRSTLFTVSLCLAAPMFAGSLPTTQLHGEYIEARTADVYTGPCFANSEVGLTGDLAVMGWKIDQGNFDGVNLDGLSVMGAIHASNTLGNVIDTVYPVKAVLIIDE